MKPFLIKSQVMWECPLSPLLFNILLDSVAGAIKIEEKNKRGSNRVGTSQIISH
jgi:hypothetical protein